jgi:Protein of unknown function (DUF3703)
MSRFARRIHASVQSELDAARRAEVRHQSGLAFSHLERAHVLGQSATLEHVRVHLQMLRWAWRQRDTGESIGQAWRCVGAALFTGIGWVPTGNTGGSNVSGFHRMPVPSDLQRLIDAAMRERAHRVHSDSAGSAIRPGHWRMIQARLQEHRLARSSHRDKQYERNLLE